MVANVDELAAVARLPEFYHVGSTWRERREKLRPRRRDVRRTLPPSPMIESEHRKTRSTSGKRGEIQKYRTVEADSSFDLFTTIFYAQCQWCQLLAVIVVAQS